VLPLSFASAEGSASLAGVGTAAPAPAANDFLPYLDERLDYDISFLWFDRLARGELRFRAGKTPGIYEAELDATTLGVASWLTGNRRQHYQTEMELTADGRLRTLFQQSLIVKGEGGKRREKGKRYVFDYPEKKVRMLRLDGGQPREDATFPMGSSEQPNDFLTCFFNFRAGRFGALREGADFRIPTFTRKGAAEISIHLLTQKERQGLKGFPAGGVLARVSLDAEVLDTGGGSVYVWFDDAGRPARGVVENVLGLGDVRGELRTQSLIRGE
jgi:hypothetical protein